MMFAANLRVTLCFLCRIPSEIHCIARAIHFLLPGMHMWSSIWVIRIVCDDPRSSFCFKLHVASVGARVFGESVTWHPSSLLVGAYLPLGVRCCSARNPCAIVGSVEGILPSREAEVANLRIVIVDEDRVVADDDMVRVGVGDCRVAHFPLVAACLDRHHRGLAAAGYPQLGTRLEVAGVDLCLPVVVPEGVVRCRLHHGGGAVAGADLDVGEFVVGVAVQLGDGFRQRCAGHGVGGHHLVADVDVGDGAGGAVGHQDAGVGGEAVRAASRS